jgi:hypothetical protein
MEDFVAFEPRVTETISRGGLDAVRQAFTGDCLSCYGFDCRQIEGDAFHMRMSFATRVERRPVAPPTSQRVWYFEKAGGRYA